MPAPRIPLFRADFVFSSGNFRGWHVGDLVFAAERGNLIRCQTPRPSRRLTAEGWCSMELAVFVVVLIVAGAVIPGDSKIRFYR